MKEGLNKKNASLDSVQSCGWGGGVWSNLKTLWFFLTIMKKKQCENQFEKHGSKLNRGGGGGQG